MKHTICVLYTFSESLEVYKMIKHNREDGQELWCCAYISEFVFFHILPSS
jgi:hypothetical protein